MHTSQRASSGGALHSLAPGNGVPSANGNGMPIAGHSPPRPADASTLLGDAHTASTIRAGEAGDGASAPGRGAAARPAAPAAPAAAAADGADSGTAPVRLYPALLTQMLCPVSAKGDVLPCW